MTVTDCNARVLFPHVSRETPSQPTHVAPRHPNQWPLIPPLMGPVQGAGMLGCSWRKLEVVVEVGGIFSFGNVLSVGLQLWTCGVDGWGWRWLSCPVIRSEKLRCSSLALKYATTVDKLYHSYFQRATLCFLWCAFVSQTMYCVFCWSPARTVFPSWAVMRVLAFP